MVAEMMQIEPSLSFSQASKFLKGRKFNLNRAISTYRSYLAAIQKYSLQNITIQDVKEELRTRKMFIPGSLAKDNSTLFIINAAHHNPNSFTRQQTLSLAFFMAQYAMESSETQNNGITIISNFKGVSWSNLDIDFQKTIINLFSNNIPLSVKHIVIYDPPWMLNALIKIISPFLKQKIRDRIVITKDLTEFVDANCLPLELGGNFPFDVDYFIAQQEKYFIQDIELDIDVREIEEELKKEKKEELKNEKEDWKKGKQDELEKEDLRLEKEEDYSSLTEYASSDILMDLDMKIQARRESIKFMDLKDVSYDDLVLLPDWNVLRRVDAKKHPKFLTRNENESITDFVQRLEKYVHSDEGKKKKNRNIVLNQIFDSSADLTNMDYVQQKKESISKRRQSLRELLSAPAVPAK